ncbi:response regulator transcription factor [Streptomyces spectabilis]|uniref:response regulator n=1 Tax=Streptomyces spectabilis TaxID=68270 RepID=UPI001CEF6E69|nr:response regulator transcription factor [Streptomyces spectabilis]
MAGRTAAVGSRALTTPADSSELTVVLADDHPVVRGGLRALLGSIDGIRVVGEASGGRAAVRETLLHRPLVLVIDLEMPDLDGVSATREVLASAPDTAVLVLTMFEDDESVFAAMRAGARGYILKGAAQDEIVRAVRCVAAGEAIFGPRIARRVAEWMARPRDAAARSPFPELTARELEVLDLIAAGMANPAIARRLQLAPKTISNHVSAIFVKLQVADRATAIVRARDAGLGRA